MELSPILFLFLAAWLPFAISSSTKSLDSTIEESSTTQQRNPPPSLNVAIGGGGGDVFLIPGDKTGNQGKWQLPPPAAAQTTGEQQQPPAIVVNAAAACTTTIIQSNVYPCTKWDGTETIYPSTRTAIQQIDCQGCADVFIQRDVYFCPMMTIKARKTENSPSTTWRTLCSPTLPVATLPTATLPTRARPFLNGETAVVTAAVTARAKVRYMRGL